MKYHYCTLLLLFVCGFIQGQTHQARTVTNAHSEQAPFLKDWFLSTGNWEKDPQLYVYEFGTGRDTVIMLHGGWGGEHSGLVDAVRDLKDQYHFVFYDQRGSLRSPFPDSLVSFANHIDDLELLRKEMQLDKMIIVGHSMGSVLASAYATKYPDHIRHLVLLAPARLKYPIPEEDDRLLQQVSDAKNDFINRQETTRELQRYNLTRQSPALSSREETMRHRINMSKLMLYDVTKWTLMNDGKAIFKAHLFPLVESTYPKEGWNYIAEFKKRNYAVNIIIGDHDFLDFGSLLMKKYVAEVPRTKLGVIKNAGHVLWIDQPAEFTRELRGALRGSAVK